MVSANALTKVKVHRSHPIFHKALEVQRDPLSGEIWREGRWIRVKERREGGRERGKKRRGRAGKGGRKRR